MAARTLGFRVQACQCTRYRLAVLTCVGVSASFICVSDGRTLQGQLLAHSLCGSCLGATAAAASMCAVSRHCRPTKDAVAGWTQQ